MRLMILALGFLALPLPMTAGCGGRRGGGGGGDGDAGPDTTGDAPREPAGPDNPPDTRPDTCSGWETSCSNGIDDDCNGFVDCLDPYCRLDVACAGVRESICNDRLDNDDDGLTDCADPDCETSPACDITSERGLCTNGIDDDRDGPTDCLDSDCSTDPACIIGGSCGGPHSGSGSNGGSGTTCLATYTFNTIAGNTYTISTCGTYTGDPYLVVSGACACRVDDFCGFGSECSCVATTSGTATICASTFSTASATWTYTITGVCR